MDHFFDSNYAVALKLQEIQYKFVDGVGYLLAKYNGNYAFIHYGINKLWKLKKYYEDQVKACANSPNKVKDIPVCFKCFDKENGPCTDCD